MSIIQPVRGTRDFYPEDMAARQWLYSKIRAVSESFGYQEYDGPFLERLELYAAKSGEELVNEQSYVFADRSGTQITLRPELTLSLARMIAQRSKALIPPLRWWSFGPFWRYERTQKGRSREFFQWNIDLIGVDSAQADAEIVAVGADLFRAIGLSPEVIRIKVNNRKLAESELERLGLPQSQRQLALQAHRSSGKNGRVCLASVCFRERLGRRWIRRTHKVHRERSGLGSLGRARSILRSLRGARHRRVR